MRITSKGEYGLRALFDLAQRYAVTSVTSADIAERQQIPDAYLNQLLITLRKAGLVRSTRGPQGGHRLARPPNRITLADAVRALEGDYSVAGSLESPSPSNVPVEADVLGDVWRLVDETVQDLLESTTLADLCQRKLAREQEVMYYI